MVIVYKKREVIYVPSDSPKSDELRNEIENLAVNIDNAFELIPEESKLDEVKKKGLAAELIYPSPKELKIDILNNPIKVKSIFIPISGGGFPEALILIYIGQNNYPHTLANTKQSKDKLIGLVNEI